MEKNISLSMEELRNVSDSISCNKPEDEFGTFYKIKLLYINTIVIPNDRTTHFEKAVEYHLSKKNNNYYYYKFTDNELVYMSNEFRSNHLVKNIYHIMKNIEKLNDGNIKKYNISSQLELEVLCDYLKKNNILHTIYIDSLDLIKKGKNNCLYDDYKQHFTIYKPYFNHYDPNYEKNKMKVFKLYIQVYKGYVNLLFRKSNIEIPKYGIYILPINKN